MQKYLLTLRLLIENDFIDHNIVPYYQKNEISLSNEVKHLVFNYQYIKYESDNGIIFNDKSI